MKGLNNGKKILSVRIGANTFEIIHLLADRILIQVCSYFILFIYIRRLNVCAKVLVDAIVNTGSGEYLSRIGSAGTVRRQVIDVSPLRSVN
jgi:small subunit ribosomal protein S5e